MVTPHAGKAKMPRGQKPLAEGEVGLIRRWIVEGAGGIATDWRGKPLSLASDGRVLVAGDDGAHREALALLAA